MTAWLKWEKCFSPAVTVHAHGSFLQDLITQYRTRLDSSLQFGAGDTGAGSGLMSRPELHDQLLKITSDNVSDSCSCVT